MKLSKRLLAIANYINHEDKVVDVGCDHGYLDIYLALNKKNKMIIASDISPLVIKATQENIAKYNLEDKIKVYCTDGIKNIRENYDTLILSGLGAHTIIQILAKDVKAKKIIIQSNNHWDMIRKHVVKMGFGLFSEKLIYEKKKLYSIMLFKKKKNHIMFQEKLVGVYNENNIEEYKIWLHIIQNILTSIPKKHFFKRLKYQKQLKYIKKYLAKKNRAVC
ncbi:MAG: SAM-dependent methyltransferase [Bacilli bacterium]|nr:SAM-dependent methyltransferase [Bacilli bacterium]